MLAQTLQTKRPHPVASGARSARLQGWLFIFMVISLGTAMAGDLEAETQVPPGSSAASGVVVSYVSEVPWPAYAGMANPLERWARQLSASWAAPAAASSARLNNLRPELSFRQMLKDAGNGTRRKADVYLVHGYELLELGEGAPLQPLLIPSCNGKPSMAEFVILRRRQAPEPGGSQKFSMEELAHKIILVDRGGCGELVYRWLEAELVPVSGHSRRENFAEFRTATNAMEAVLSVYFGEADACVVSREDYDSVLRTNPSGLHSRLEEVCQSPQLLRHLVACRSDMEPEFRQLVVRASASVRMPLNGIVWSLSKPSSQDMESLRTLLNLWQRYYPDTILGASPSALPPAAPSINVRLDNERRVP
jgi:hypothetical protein